MSVSRQPAGPRERIAGKLTFALRYGPVAGIACLASFRLMSKADGALLLRGREGAGQGSNAREGRSLRRGRPLMRDSVHAGMCYLVERWFGVRGLMVGVLQGAPARASDQ